MPEPIRLRAGGPADYDEILRVWREASRVGHPFLSDADLEAQERLTRKAHLPRAELVVAEQTGAIIGFIATHEDRIGALFVAPEAQGRGVGRRLIEHAQAGRAKLQLGVYEANHAARAFYRRCGFVQIGRSEHDDEGRALAVLELTWRPAHPPLRRAAPSAAAQEADAPDTGADAAAVTGAGIGGTPVPDLRYVQALSCPSAGRPDRGRAGGEFQA